MTGGPGARIVSGEGRGSATHRFPAAVATNPRPSTMFRAATRFPHESALPGELFTRARYADAATKTARASGNAILT